MCSDPARRRQSCAAHRSADRPSCSNGGQAGRRGIRKQAASCCLAAGATAARIWQQGRDAGGWAGRAEQRHLERPVRGIAEFAVHPQRRLWHAADPGRAVCHASIRHPGWIPHRQSGSTVAAVHHHHLAPIILDWSHPFAPYLVCVLARTSHGHGGASNIRTCWFERVAWLAGT